MKLISANIWAVVTALLAGVIGLGLYIFNDYRSVAVDAQTRVGELEERQAVHITEDEATKEKVDKLEKLPDVVNEIKNTVAADRAKSDLILKRLDSLEAKQDLILSRIPAK